MHSQKFYLNSLTFNLLPVVALFSYGLLNPYFKPKFGEYSHSIMTVLALVSIREVSSAFSQLKSVYLFGIDNIFLTLALIALNFFLLKKLNFVYSTAGQIYSQILHNRLSIGNLKIEGRDAKGFMVFASFVYYLYSRKIIIFPILLIISFIIKYLNPPFILSLNIITFAIVTLFVFIYLINVYNRRIKNKDFFISQRTN
ncbi:hypothetical protein JXQ31_00205 [candidate division KSB1 bacterium]|nr:hypothetical protein [candidate division KSB1 bacterium]